MLSSPEELALVADELPVAIWLGRVPSGEVLYTNRAFREVLGIDPPAGAARGEFVQPYGVHLPDGTPYPEDRMPFEVAIRARETVVVDDLVIHRHDGRHVNLRVFAKPLFDAQGQITHVLEAFIDITREVEAERAKLEGERKLARSQRLESLGQLATGIAHDFNNLLTVTTLTVSRLLNKLRDPELRTALLDIETVTTSAVELVKQLVGYATRAPQSLAPVQLDAILRAVVELAGRTFDRRLTITLSEHGAPAWVRGDRAQLEQVIMNLLVNARDAIVGPGRIAVHVRRATLRAHQVETCAAGEYVVVEVADDGPGIDPAIRDRIFEPYFTTKTRGAIKGTGLGLATVLGIVRAHAGFIEAAASSPRGTTIRIALPVHADAPLATTQDTRALPRGAGQLVLVVDDEPLVRAATAEALRGLDYRVLEADGGPQALELFAAHGGAIAAVVMDMMMPGTTATAVYDALRAGRADVPIIVMTGAADQAEVDQLLARGVVRCLTKPFEQRQLGELLAEVLSSG